MRVPARVISPGVTVPIVAIDGPAGAGKSTVARELARRLGFTIVDTGAIYRAVALAAQRANIGWEDDAGLSRLLDAGLGISFAPAADGQRVLLHGEDVTEAIRRRGGSGHPRHGSGRGGGALRTPRARAAARETLRRETHPNCVRSIP